MERYYQSLGYLDDVILLPMLVDMVSNNWSFMEEIRCQKWINYTMCIIYNLK